MEGRARETGASDLFTFELGFRNAVQLHLLPIVHERPIHTRNRPLAQHTAAREQIVQRLPKSLLLPRLLLRTTAHRPVRPHFPQLCRARDRTTDNSQQRVGEDELAELVEALDGGGGEFAAVFEGATRAGGSGGGVRRGRGKLRLKVEHATQVGGAEMLCDLRGCQRANRERGERGDSPR